MDNVETKSCPMDKKTFLQQYVLNRAATNIYGLDGLAAVTEAVKAYEKIEEVCEDKQ